jgi:hypothetical protein
MAMVASRVAGGTVVSGTSPLSCQIFTVAAAGSYTTGGMTLDLTAIGVPSASVPKLCYITGQGGAVYSYVPGTTAANGLLKVFVEGTVATNALLIEHSATTLVAGVSGDAIAGQVYY